MACKITPDGSVGGSGPTGLTGIKGGSGNKTLTEEDWNNAAAYLGCEVEALKAVAKVESRGDGFFSDGQPKILFERHIFWGQLRKEGIDPNKYFKGNEDILNPKSGGYIGGVKEYDRLNRAMMIDGGSEKCKEAALRSASWGMFQVMGFNFETVGCSSVYDLIDKAKESEYQQLLLGCNYIKKVGTCLNAIRSTPPRFDKFAEGYNGSDYKKNNYDVKMRNYYNALKGQK